MGVAKSRAEVLPRLDRGSPPPHLTGRLSRAIYVLRMGGDRMGADARARWEAEFRVAAALAIGATPVMRRDEYDNWGHVLEVSVPVTVTEQQRLEVD